MEAIRVPRPPTFTPTISSRRSLLYPDRSMAAGTLLMTWLTSTPMSRSRPAIAPPIQVWSASSCFKLPTKIKKNTKVRIRE